MPDGLPVSFANDLATSAVMLQAEKSASSREFSFVPAGDTICLSRQRIFPPFSLGRAYSFLLQFLANEIISVSGY